MPSSARRSRSSRARCPGVLDPLEIWHFQGSDLVAGDFFLVFRERHRDGEQGLLAVVPQLRLRPAVGPPRRLGRPAEQLPAVGGRGVLPRRRRGRRPLARGGLGAPQGERQAAARPGRPSGSTPSSPPRTDLPEGSSQFAARLDLTFPGRYQSRTVVQGLVAVPRAEVEPGADAAVPLLRLPHRRRGAAQGRPLRALPLPLPLPAGGAGRRRHPAALPALPAPRRLRAGGAGAGSGLGPLLPPEPQEIEVPFGRSGSQLAAAGGAVGPTGGEAGAAGAGAAAPIPPPRPTPRLATGDQTLRILPRPAGPAGGQHPHRGGDQRRRHGAGALLPQRQAGDVEGEPALQRRDQPRRPAAHPHRGGGGARRRRGTSWPAT